MESSFDGPVSSISAVHWRLPSSLTLIMSPSSDPLPATSESTAYLVVRDGSTWRDVFRLLPGQVTTLGRAPTNRVVLRDDVCSRNHCEIFYSDSAWTLRDLKSRNGTHVNGDLVHDDWELQEGQVIQIGSCAIGFTHDISKPFEAFENDLLERPTGDTVAGYSEIIAVDDQSSSAELEGGEIVHRASSSRYGRTESEELELSERTNFELAHLYRFGIEMGSAKDAVSLCRTGIEGLRSTTNAGVGAIFLLGEPVTRNADPEQLSLVAYDCADDQSFERVSSSLSRIVLESREAILARDVTDDSALAESESLNNFAVESVLCAPIQFEQTIFGVIHLYALSMENRLSPDDLEFTLAVADQMALALKSLTERESLATTAARYRDENVTLRRQLELDSQLVGKSLAIRSLRETITRIAPTDATTLIRGEGGVGKELVARAIHENSDRRRGPFVCMNCAALNESLLESELFGHEKGSFTGAVGRKSGKFEQANQGTLFLDEVGEMSPIIQAKFLRVLEGHAFERVGGHEPVSVNVRVVAATNRDLEEAVATGDFRKDLYFRLHVVEISVVPLRERKSDVPLLADYFLERSARRSKRNVTGFSRTALQILMDYEWPGNVRELQNVVERAVILCRQQEVQAEDVHLSGLGIPDSSHAIPTNGVTHSDYREISLEQHEKEHILATLEHTEWNKSRAAQILGIERSTLDRKLKRYDVQRPNPGG